MKSNDVIADLAPLSCQVRQPPTLLCIAVSQLWKQVSIYYECYDHLSR